MLVNKRLINKILNNLNTIPDETLMMSYQDCHMKGLHSIVLNNNMGRLTRFFITTPDHKMYENLGTLSPALGIHNHKYDIDLTILFGNVININFSVSPTDRLFEVNCRSYQYKDREVYNQGCFNSVHQESIEMVTTAPMHIPQKQLHTVYVPCGQVAAWLVEEGEEVQDYTSMYTNREVSNSHDNYKCFENAQEVRDFVKTMLQTFK